MVPPVVAPMLVPLLLTDPELTLDVCVAVVVVPPVVEPAVRFVLVGPLPTTVLVWVESTPSMASFDAGEPLEQAASAPSRPT